MPTPEEIENLAKQYAEFTDLSVVDQLRVKLISKEFLTWVLRDYCIVPKEVIKVDYEHNKLAVEQFSKSDATRCVILREWHQGKCDELKSIFGSLFEEEKG